MYYVRIFEIATATTSLATTCFIFPVVLGYCNFLKLIMQSFIKDTYTPWPVHFRLHFCVLLWTFVWSSMHKICQSLL